MTDKDEATARAAMVETARAMNARGINQGTSGNIGVRLDGGHFLVTPSGVPYDDMRPGDIVRMSFDGSFSGDFAPSTEWRVHRDILAARDDVDTVIHAHPLYCTSLSCLRRDIPPFHYMVAVAGGTNIRCADYATVASQALSDNALAALRGRKACLLANHGMIAIGKGLDKTLALAVEVETLAAQYCHALRIGEPVLLDDAEMARVLALFKDYGRPRRTRA